jgi:hypothetical protein
VGGSVRHDLGGAGATLRRGLAVALLACLPAAGCGPGPSAQEQVRDVVTQFARATEARDYQTLCDRILAPQLVDKLKQIGLPCELALQQGLGDVREPRLTIGKITIGDHKATAEVRTSAVGEQPSRDILQLVELDQGWRIASLGT